MSHEAGTHPHLVSREMMDHMQREHARTVADLQAVVRDLANAGILLRSQAAHADLDDTGCGCLMTNGPAYFDEIHTKHIDLIALAAKREYDAFMQHDRAADHMLRHEPVSDVPFPPPPDAPTEEELHALDHPDECCWASDNHCCGNDHMTQGEAEAKEMQEQTSEYRRMT